MPHPCVTSRLVTQCRKKAKISSPRFACFGPLCMPKRRSSTHAEFDHQDMSVWSRVKKGRTSAAAAPGPLLPPTSPPAVAVAEAGHREDMRRISNKIEEIVGLIVDKTKEIGVVGRLIIAETNLAKQTELKAQQAELETQQAELETQQAELEAQQVPVTVLSDEMPSLESLVALFAPEIAFYNLDTSENAAVPSDFRFYRAERPAAKLILNALPLRIENKVISKLVYAPSGFGKTSTAFDVGREVFTMYCACTPIRVGEATHTKSGEECNTSFPLYRERVSLETGNMYVAGEISKHMATAVRLSASYIVSHVFILYVFLTVFPQATPYQFLRYQLSAVGASHVAAAFENWRKSH